MSRHLGGALTAFVDGELDHGAREQVLVHLAHCASCRGEVELLRGLKGALRHEPRRAPEDLAARLLAMTASPGQPAFVPRVPTSRGGALTGHARVRRTAFGLGMIALGVGGAMAVAGPPPAAPVAPVDPTSAGLVIEHASTANEVPFAGTDIVPAANPLSVR
jgi:anti-sigma factor RsiW